MPAPLRIPIQGRRIRPALPPLPIPENKTPAMSDFRQAPTVKARIGNRTVTIRSNTRLYVPGMLSDADQSYLDRMDLAKGTGLGIAPLAIAAAAASFIHFGSSERYEGGPLLSTVWNELGNNVKPLKTADQVRQRQAYVAAQGKGWGDVAAILIPALRPDVFPAGPPRALTTQEQGILAKVGGPVTVAPPPPPITSTVPAPPMIPVQPPPPSLAIPVPAVPLPSAPPGMVPVVTGGTPQAPTVIFAPAPAPGSPVQIPTTGPNEAGILGGGGALPILLGAGLLFFVAMGSKK